MNSIGLQTPFPQKVHEGRGSLPPNLIDKQKYMKLQDFKINEADVQFELIELINRNVEFACRAEARWPSRHHRSGWMRIDILVFRGDFPLCMIEVKKSGKKPIGKNTRQNFAYKDSGLPVFFCIGREDISKTYDCVLRTT